MTRVLHFTSRRDSLMTRKLLHIKQSVLLCHFSQRLKGPRKLLIQCMLEVEMKKKKMIKKAKNVIRVEKR